MRTLGGQTPNALTVSVNGTEIAPRRTVSRLTLRAQSQDTLFDLGDTLRLGRNDVVIRVDRRNRDFDIDVYEVGEIGPEARPPRPVPKIGH